MVAVGSGHCFCFWPNLSKCDPLVVLSGNILGVTFAEIRPKTKPLARATLNVPVGLRTWVTQCPVPSTCTGYEGGEHPAGTAACTLTQTRLRCKDSRPGPGGRGGGCWGGDGGRGLRGLTAGAGSAGWRPWSLVAPSQTWRGPAWPALGGPPAPPAPSSGKSLTCGNARQGRAGHAVTALHHTARSQCCSADLHASNVPQHTSWGNPARTAGCASQVQRAAGCR